MFSRPFRGSTSEHVNVESAITDSGSCAGVRPSNGRMITAAARPAYPRAARLLVIDERDRKRLFPSHSARARRSGPRPAANAIRRGFAMRLAANSHEETG